MISNFQVIFLIGSGDFLPTSNTPIPGPVLQSPLSVDVSAYLTESAAKPTGQSMAKRIDCHRKTLCEMMLEKKGGPGTECGGGCDPTVPGIYIYIVSPPFMLYT